MDKIELIKLFLKEKGLTWEGEIYDDNRSGLRKATDKDFNKDKISVIPVDIIKYGLINEIDLCISVDLLSFISWGIAFDTPSCFAVNDEFRDILDQNNLSDQWQDLCLKNKGLVYKMAVEKFVETAKQEASDNCHKETIKHIKAINKQTELKKEIFNMLDFIQTNIDEKYNELNT